MNTAPRCPASGKVMYDKKGAKTAANLAFEAGRGKMRVYECPSCGRWHLTHVDDR